MKKVWEEKRLGDIGKVSMCKRIFKDQTVSNGDIPFYKIGTFGKEPDAFISNEIYNEYRKKYSFPKKGDVLISASGTIGRRVRYDGKPAYFQDSNIVWIDNDEMQISNDYLYHFYGACKWNTTKGATISRLYNDNLKQLEIAFPKSKEEQKRIVGILDKAFAAITTAKENAEKNLANARELFESYLQSVFANPGDGWEEKKLVEVCAKITDGEHIRPNIQSDGIPFLSAKDVQENDVIFDDVLFVSEEDSAKFRKRCNPEKGDILIVSRGATVGRTCIVKTNRVFCLLGSVILLKTEKNVIADFLTYTLKSAIIRDKVANASEASAQQAIYLRDIKEIPVPLPPLAEQRRIVAKLDALAAETKKLEAIYRQKLADLDELKKSVLKRAFEGEL